MDEDDVVQVGSGLREMPQVSGHHQLQQPEQIRRQGNAHPPLRATGLRILLRDDADLIRVRMWESVFQSAAIQQLARDLGDDGWWLDQTFVDFNSSKAASFLSYLAAGAVV